MRLFVALDLSEEVRARLEELLRRLSGWEADVRWVRPAGMHLTLKFLGEVPAEKLQPIRDALAQANSPEPVRLAFRGLGYFPNEKRPRVIWTGVEASPNLSPLAAQVESLLEPLGFPAEKRPYVPHLTLGRFKSTKGLERLRPIIAGLPEREFGELEANEFFLFQSRLSPQGAEYTKLASFPFVRS